MADTANPSGNDPRFRVVDLHTHPSLKAYMFRTRFWRAHNPPSGFFPLSMRVDLDALLAGGVKTFVCAAYAVERPMFADIWPLGLLTKMLPRARHLAVADPRELLLEYLDFAEEMVAETRKHRGDVVEVARSRADMQRITGAGKLCMIHAVEGAHHLNGDLGLVDELAARGVCYMIVPHLYPNEAGGCTDVFSSDPRTRLAVGCFSKKRQNASGMSFWGRELVEKLLDVGIMVDPTHGTPEFRREVIDMARRHPKKRPVLMSHTCVPDMGKNRGDPLPEDIRGIAETGGVVGVMMVYQPHLAGRPDAGVETMIGAVDFLMQHGGENVVAMGSDLDGFTTVPKDLRSPRGYTALREAMLRRYTEAQVEKFLGGNAERVLMEGWGR